MKIIFSSLLLLFLNFFIYYKFEKLSMYFSLKDKPDNKLKKHKKSVSIFGGLILLINLYLILFILYIFGLDNFLFSKRFIFFLLFISTSFYLIGLLDDIKNLSPNLKLFLICFTSGLLIYKFPEINIELIKISFLDKIYYFNNFSILFLIICFALLTNALNMFDGINLQLILFSVFVFIIFILKGFLILFYSLIVLSLFFLGIMNYKNKLFLGDGGSYLISSIIGSSFIYQYNYFENFLYGDEIFIILLIPSIDMLRLFLVRLINKKNPFKGDLNHLHHIIDNNFKNTNHTLIISILLFIFPSILLIFEIQTYFILTVSIFIYILTIMYFKKNII